MTHSICQSENNQLVYKGEKLELFVPEEYFKTALAVEVGTKYKLFGYLQSLHFNNVDDPRTKARHALMMYPMSFFTAPKEVNKEELDLGNGITKYRVFTYYKNDVLFETDDIIQDGENAQTFFSMLTAGHLDMVKYSKMAKLMQLCKYYNGVNFGTPAMYEEVIISDYYRSPSNVKQAARFEAALSDPETFYARGITEREKVAFTSTFSGLTFEDETTMLTMSDNASREGRQEVISEVEKRTLGLN